MAIYTGIDSNGIFVSSDGFRLQDANGSDLLATPSNHKWKLIINNISYNVNYIFYDKESE